MSAVDADVEAIVVEWLAGQHPEARLCTETPDNLADVVPCIQVVSIGGRDRFTLNSSTVDVDCFQIGRIPARELAYQVWADLRFKMPGFVTSGGASVSRVETVLSPAWRPYDNTNLRRVGITVLVIVHTPSFAD